MIVSGSRGPLSAALPLEVLQRKDIKPEWADGVALLPHMLRPRVRLAR